ncbi:hypothetical protein F5Y11DRAFT_208749 [Daldinia sp. FL1419]|nr:hypothetical protein F5Y11DRAFT_208749 [Daldinia sp. FL1419]
MKFGLYSMYLSSLWTSSFAFDMSCFIRPTKLSWISQQAECSLHASHLLALYCIYIHPPIYPYRLHMKANQSTHSPI